MFVMTDEMDSLSRKSVHLIVLVVIALYNLLQLTPVKRLFFYGLNSY